jgi:hypothetical protein
MAATSCGRSVFRPDAQTRSRYACHMVAVDRKSPMGSPYWLFLSPSTSSPASLSASRLSVILVCVFPLQWFWCRLV